MPHRIAAISVAASVSYTEIKLQSETTARER